MGLGDAKSSSVDNDIKMMNEKGHLLFLSKITQHNTNIIFSILSPKL